MRAIKLVSILAATLVSLAHAESGAEYTAEEAAKHIGETATVTGKAERVNKASGGNTFIELSSGGARFTVFISTKDAAAVGDVEQYKGKELAVSGKIVEFKDKVEIVVTSASQIKVKEAAEKPKEDEAKK